jgi:hypothetical protein
VAGRTRVRLPAGRGGGVSFLGEWREVESRPLQGNAPCNRAGKPRVFSCWEHLRRSLLRHSIPAASKIATGALGRRFRGRGIYRSDVGQPQPNPRPSRTASRQTGLSPGKERDGRTALFSSSAMSSTGYSSIGLVATRARLRFTGTCRLPCPPQSSGSNTTFLLCQEHDISTLP